MVIFRVCQFCFLGQNFIPHHIHNHIQNSDPVPLPGSLTRRSLVAFQSQSYQAGSQGVIEIEGISPPPPSTLVLSVTRVLVLTPSPRQRRLAYYNTIVYIVVGLQCCICSVTKCNIINIINKDKLLNSLPYALPCLIYIMLSSLCLLGYFVWLCIDLMLAIQPHRSSLAQVVGGVYRPFFQARSKKILISECTKAI